MEASADAGAMAAPVLGPAPGALTVAPLTWRRDARSSGAGVACRGNVLP
jgi:hypothetical protein